MSARRILFLDRDGTLNEEVPDEQVDSLAKIRLMPGVVPALLKLKSAGFSFPFGDYFGMAIDGRGQTHVVWGQGLNFDSPGSIWYTNGR